MERFVTKEQLSEYLILPKNFDWEHVDQEIGFAEIFDIIPKQIYNSITDEKIKKLLTKTCFRQCLNRCRKFFCIHMLFYLQRLWHPYSQIVHVLYLFSF